MNHDARSESGTAPPGLGRGHGCAVKTLLAALGRVWTGVSSALVFSCPEWWGGPVCIRADPRPPRGTLLVAESLRFRLQLGERHGHVVARDRGPVDVPEACSCQRRRQRSGVVCVVDARWERVGVSAPAILPDVPGWRAETRGAAGQRSSSIWPARLGFVKEH